MEKEFIPLELTLKLIELGFNGYYKLGEWVRFTTEGVNNSYYFRVCPTNLLGEFEVKCLTITWSQAFDWLDKHFGLFVSFDKIDNTRKFYYDFSIIDSIRREYNDEDLIDSASRKLNWSEFKTYQEARQASLEKLIEIVENGRS